MSGVSSSISAVKNCPVLHSHHVSVLLLRGKQISFGEDPKMQLIYWQGSRRQGVKNLPTPTKEHLGEALQGSQWFKLQRGNKHSTPGWI